MDTYTFITYKVWLCFNVDTLVYLHKVFHITKLRFKSQVEPNVWFLAKWKVNSVLGTG